MSHPLVCITCNTSRTESNRISEMRRIVFSANPVSSSHIDVVAVASLEKLCFMKITDGKCIGGGFLGLDTLVIPFCGNSQSKFELEINKILTEARMVKSVAHLKFDTILTQYVHKSFLESTNRFQSIYDSVNMYQDCLVSDDISDAIINEILLLQEGFTISVHSAPDILNFFDLGALLDLCILIHLHSMKMFSLCNNSDYSSPRNLFLEDIMYVQPGIVTLSDAFLKLKTYVTAVLRADDSDVFRLEADKVLVDCFLHNFQIFLDEAHINESVGASYENTMWHPNVHVDTCHIARSLLTTIEDIELLTLRVGNIVSDIVISRSGVITGTTARKTQIENLEGHKCEFDVEMDECTSIEHIGACLGMPCYWDGSCKNIPSGYYSPQGDPGLHQCIRTLSGPMGVMTYRRDDQNLVNPENGYCDVFCNSFDYTLDPVTNLCIPTPHGKWAPKCSEISDINDCTSHSDGIFLTSGYGDEHSCIKASIFSSTLNEALYLIYDAPPFYLSVEFSFSLISNPPMEFHLFGVLNFFYVQVNIIATLVGANETGYSMSLTYFDIRRDPQIITSAEWPVLDEGRAIGVTIHVTASNVRFLVSEQLVSEHPCHYTHRIVNNDGVLSLESLNGVEGIITTPLPDSLIKNSILLDINLSYGVSFNMLQIYVGPLILPPFAFLFFDELTDDVKVQSFIPIHNPYYSIISDVSPELILSISQVYVKIPKELDTYVLPYETGVSSTEWSQCLSSLSFSEERGTYTQNVYGCVRHPRLFSIQPLSPIPSCWPPPLDYSGDHFLEGQNVIVDFLLDDPNIISAVVNSIGGNQGSPSQSQLSELPVKWRLSQSDIFNTPLGFLDVKFNWVFDDTASSDPLNIRTLIPNLLVLGTGMDGPYNPGLFPVYALTGETEKGRPVFVLNESVSTVTLRVQTHLYGYRQTEQENCIFMIPKRHDCNISLLIDESMAVRLKYGEIIDDTWHFYWLEYGYSLKDLYVRGFEVASPADQDLSSAPDFIKYSWIVFYKNALLSPQTQSDIEFPWNYARDFQVVDRFLLDGDLKELHLIYRSRKHGFDWSLPETAVFRAVNDYINTLVPVMPIFTVERVIDRAQEFLEFWRSERASLGIYVPPSSMWVATSGFPAAISNTKDNGGTPHYNLFYTFFTQVELESQRQVFRKSILQIFRDDEVNWVNSSKLSYDGCDFAQNRVCGLSQTSLAFPGEEIQITIPGGLTLSAWLDYSEMSISSESAFIRTTLIAVPRNSTHDIRAFPVFVDKPPIGFEKSESFSEILTSSRVIKFPTFFLQEGVARFYLPHSYDEKYNMFLGCGPQNSLMEGYSYTVTNYPLPDKLLLFPTTGGETGESRVIVRYAISSHVDWREIDYSVWNETTIGKQIVFPDVKYDSSESYLHITCRVSQLFSYSEPSTYHLYTEKERARGPLPPILAIARLTQSVDEQNDDAVDTNELSVVPHNSAPLSKSQDIVTYPIISALSDFTNYITLVAESEVTLFEKISASAGWLITVEGTIEKKMLEFNIPDNEIRDLKFSLVDSVSVKTVQINNEDVVYPPEECEWPVICRINYNNSHSRICMDDLQCEIVAIRSLEIRLVESKRQLCAFSGLKNSDGDSGKIFPSEFRVESHAFCSHIPTSKEIRNGYSRLGSVYGVFQPHTSQLDSGVPQIALPVWKSVNGDPLLIRTDEGGYPLFYGYSVGRYAHLMIEKICEGRCADFLSRDTFCHNCLSVVILSSPVGLGEVFTENSFRTGIIAHEGFINTRSRIWYPLEGGKSIAMTQESVPIPLPVGWVPQNQSYINGDKFSYFYVPRISNTLNIRYCIPAYKIVVRAHITGAVEYPNNESSFFVSSSDWFIPSHNNAVFSSGQNLARYSPGKRNAFLGTVSDTFEVKENVAHVYGPASEQTGNINSEPKILWSIAGENSVIRLQYLQDLRSVLFTWSLPLCIHEAPVDFLMRNDTTAAILGGCSDRFNLKNVNDLDDGPLPKSDVLKFTKAQLTRSAMSVFPGNDSAGYLESEFDIKIPTGESLDAIIFRDMKDEIDIQYKKCEFPQICILMNNDIRLGTQEENEYSDGNEPILVTDLSISISTDKNQTVVAIIVTQDHWFPPSVTSSTATLLRMKTGSNTLTIILTLFGIAIGVPILLCISAIYSTRVKTFLWGLINRNRREPVQTNTLFKKGAPEEDTDIMEDEDEGVESTEPYQIPDTESQYTDSSTDGLEDEKSQDIVEKQEVQDNSHNHSSENTDGSVTYHESYSIDDKTEERDEYSSDDSRDRNSDDPKTWNEIGKK